MGSWQTVSHEPLIGAPATVIESNTGARVHRGSSDTEKAEKLQALAINTIRNLAMDAVQKANSGHPGTPMALAPAAFVLWDRHLRHNPANPLWPNRQLTMGVVRQDSSIVGNTIRSLYQQFREYDFKLVAIMRRACCLTLTRCLRLMIASY